MKSILSLLSERREMRTSENAILGVGVGSNPDPLAPEYHVRHSTSTSRMAILIKATQCYYFGPLIN